MADQRGIRQRRDELPEAVIPPAEQAQGGQEQHNGGMLPWLNEHKYPIIAGGVALMLLTNPLTTLVGGLGALAGYYNFKKEPSMFNATSIAGSIGMFIFSNPVIWLLCAGLAVSGMAKAATDITHEAKSASNHVLDSIPYGMGEKYKFQEQPIPVPVLVQDRERGA